MNPLEAFGLAVLAFALVVALGLAILDKVTEGKGPNALALFVVPFVVGSVVAVGTFIGALVL